MTDFKVGDRVRLVHNSNVRGEARLTGVIRQMKDKECIVELDNPELASKYIRLWDCSGVVPSGNGRVINKCCLELHEEVVTGVLSIGEGIL